MKIFTEKGFQEELYRRASAADKERWERERFMRQEVQTEKLAVELGRIIDLLEKKELITPEESRSLRARSFDEYTCNSVEP